MPLPEFIESSATMSPCETYRYTLRRVWNAEHPICTFFMFNPSTADAFVLDRTIKRCVHFAQRENCGGLLVLNAFAIRTPYPANVKAALEAEQDIVGPENDIRIEAELAQTEGPLIAAWGEFRWARPRIQVVRNLIGNRPIQCLGVTKDGSPRHPLFVRGNAELQNLP